MEEHVYIHELPDGTQSLLGRADCPSGPAVEEATHLPAAGVIDAPAHVQIPGVEIERLAFIEIRDRKSRELRPIRPSPAIARRPPIILPRISRRSASTPR